ncbi:MAG: hypothetical protein ACMXYL_00450 [Candidatus Woesearchaeota archaeon]
MRYTILAVMLIVILVLGSCGRQTPVDQQTNNQEPTPDTTQQDPVIPDEPVLNDNNDDDADHWVDIDDWEDWE